MDKSDVEAAIQRAVLAAPKLSGVLKPKVRTKVKKPGLDRNKLNAKPRRKPGFRGNGPLTRKELERWNARSHGEQVEYLKTHPGSIYHKAPLKKRPDKSAAAAKPKINKLTQKKKAVTDAGALKTRAKTDKEQKMSRVFLKQLSKKGALDPNSKPREEAAATIEAQGTASMKALPKDLSSGAASEFKELHAAVLLSKQRKAKPMGKKERLAKKEARTNQPLKKKYPRLAQTAGMLAIAGLIGVGLAAVSPVLALVIGDHVLQHLPNILDFAKHMSDKDNADRVEANLASLILAGDDENAGEDDEAHKEIVKLVAGYVRDAKLPSDILEMLQKEVGSN